MPNAKSCCPAGFLSITTCRFAQLLPEVQTKGPLPGVTRLITHNISNRADTIIQRQIFIQTGGRSPSLHLRWKATPSLKTTES